MSMIEKMAMAMYAADGLKHLDGSSVEQSWADSPIYHEDYIRRAIAAAEVAYPAIAVAFVRGVEWCEENPVDREYRFKAGADHADAATYYDDKGA